MLANQKVRGSILHKFLLACTNLRVFTQKLPGKTRVQNTRGTREMELTESRV